MTGGEGKVGIQHIIEEDDSKGTIKRRTAHLADIIGPMQV
jgi:hypothetical protein